MSPSELPIAFDATILCEDIRTEDTKKIILLGIYSGRIAFPSLPASIILDLWLNGKTTKLGEFKFHMRVIDEKSNVIQSTSQPKVLINREMASSTVSFEKFPLNISAETVLTFQISVDNSTWHSVLTKEFIVVPPPA